MSTRPSPGADPLADAYEHCATLARAHARDQWLGALYASAKARGALFALSSFDYEIRHALTRAHNPHLAAIRLAWWREAICGERAAEAAGNPVSLALLAAIEDYALPRAWLDAMLDARLQEIAPQDDLNLVAFRAFADESEGARLRLGSCIVAGGQDLDPAAAHAPAGMALALTRLLKDLPFKAGSMPTLIPTDVAARHGVSVADFDARRVSPGVISACAELRGLARAELAEAERRLAGSAPEILPAFIPLAPLRLDLDRLDRNSDHPFDPASEASPLRRQWAIWRWARGREAAAPLPCLRDAEAPCSHPSGACRITQQIQQGVQVAKPAIVLVHGLWGNGAHWSKVIIELAKLGHETILAVENPLTSLADDAERTRKMVAQQKGPVVLAGHSYGGFVISQAGNEANVVGLVYVAAFAPDAGESIVGIGQGFPPPPGLANAAPDSDGYIWLDRKKFRESFCQDLNADEAFVAASLAILTKEWQETSIALAKPSAEQLRSPP